jgi:hypothetical protein
MKRFRRMANKPSPAMIVAIIALVVALTGTAVAAKKLSLKAFKNGTKNKTVGVGKLTYVVTSTSVPPSPPALEATEVTPAVCPSGTRVIGGGIRTTGPQHVERFAFVLRSHPTANGWGGAVLSAGSSPITREAITTAMCAVSRKVTGAPG